MGLRSLAFVVALLAGSCARDEPSTPPPLVPVTPTVEKPSTQPPPKLRSFETKTIGGDRYPVQRAPSTASTESSPTTTPRSGPWSPTPLYGDKNPSPPSPGTPLTGDLNPSPPSR